MKQRFPMKFFRFLLLAIGGMLLCAEPAFAQQPGGTSAVLEIMLLVVIAYFLIRMFRRRSGGDHRDDENTPKQPPQQGKVLRPMDRHEAAKQMWGHLSSDKESAPQEAVSAPVATVSFDKGEFLEGAKLFFSRIQHVDSPSELVQLQSFMTDSVYEELKAEAARREWIPNEVMLLNAKVMEVETRDSETTATVFYDGQVRVGPSGEESRQIRAAWEFRRDENDENALWTLEKINPVDQ